MATLQPNPWPRILANTVAKRSAQQGDNVPSGNNKTAIKEKDLTNNGQTYIRHWWGSEFPG